MALIEELGIVAFIMVITFVTQFVLSESFYSSLLFMSALLSIFVSFGAIPNYWIVLALIIFAYCIYDLIWGRKI